nr:hypothetical protein [Streptomyces sp. SID8379]
MRNPIGPLPSSIYWRRRVVLASVVALLALLIVWIVTVGGGGGNNGAGGNNGKHPTQSITPGPSGTGPAISEHPGGRDTSGGSGSGSGGGSGDGSGDSGSGGSEGSGGADDSAGGGDGAGSGGGTASGDQVPAGSKLPDCTAGGVTLAVRSLHNAYAPGEKPRIELAAKNSTDKSCKVDLGPRTAVVTITKADGDKEFWSSDDCPSGNGGLLLRVPAGGKVTHTLTWDLRPSAPKCATPPAGSATPGTYLVEVKGAQLTGTQTSFVLKAD